MLPHSLYVVSKQGTYPIEQHTHGHVELAALMLELTSKLLALLPVLVVEKLPQGVHASALLGQAGNIIDGGAQHLKHVWIEHAGLLVLPERLLLLLDTRIAAAAPLSCLLELVLALLIGRHVAEVLALLHLRDSIITSGSRRCKQGPLAESSTRMRLASWFLSMKCRAH
jgi:hypothetical protein